jgi:GR25 family glycosyltransferase involved in LPS biosynthesis
MDLQYLKHLKKSGIISRDYFDQQGKLHYNQFKSENNYLKDMTKSNEDSSNPDQMIEYDINTYFDKIYIINLDSRPDRWDKMKQKLKKNNINNFVRFPAINGKQEPYSKMYSQLSYFFDPPGAFGILMSAMHVIKDAYYHKFKKILILEDDAVFHHDFKKLFDQKIKKIPDYWKLLYLGSSMHTWRIYEKCKLKDEYLIPQGSIPGAFALGISQECYIPLVKQISTFSSAWDLGPLKYINTIFSNQCFVLYPNIIIADTRDSDIRQSKSLLLKSNDCGWDLDKYDFMD